MDPRRPALDQYRRLVGEVLEALDAGGDPDVVLVDHHLLHLFSPVLDGVTASELGVLDDWERVAVAHVVLTEMSQVIDDAIADPDADLRAVTRELHTLARRLAPCMPGAVGRYGEMTRRAERWLDAHPDVVAGLLTGVGSTTLEPEVLLVALVGWMGALDGDERAELHRRFVDDPPAAVAEILACVELAHHLDRFDGSLDLD